MFSETQLTFSLTSRPKHYVAKYQETNSSRPERGDDLGYVLSDHYWKTCVGQQPSCYPDQDVVHPNVEKCLCTEANPLLARIGVLSLIVESSMRISEVAVSVC